MLIQSFFAVLRKGFASEYSWIILRFVCDLGCGFSISSTSFAWTVAFWDRSVRVCSIVIVM